MQFLVCSGWYNVHELQNTQFQKYRRHWHESADIDDWWNFLSLYDSSYVDNSFLLGSAWEFSSLSKSLLASFSDALNIGNLLGSLWKSTSLSQSPSLRLSSLRISSGIGIWLSSVLAWRLFVRDWAVDVVRRIHHMVAGSMVQQKLRTKIC